MRPLAALLAALALLACPCAASAASTVYGWGDAGDGNESHMGNGSGASLASPTVMTELAGASQIALNDGDITFAVYPDGTVKSWGENGAGHGYTTADDIVFPTKPNDSLGLVGVKSLAISHDHGVAIMNDGSVKAWGQNNFGQAGQGTHGDTPYPPTVIPGLTGVKAVYAGDRASYAVLENGTVKGWGSDVDGQQGDGATAADCPNPGYPCVTTPTTIPGLTNVKELGVAEDHVIALLGDGTVKAWGTERAGGLGDAGTPPDTCYSNQKCAKAPIAIAGLSGVVSVGAGDYNGYAVLGDGTVKAWGRDDHGELGNGVDDPNDQDSCADLSQQVACEEAPVSVPGLQGVARVDGDGYAAMALLTNGQAVVWGQGLGVDNDDAHEYHSPVDTGLNGITSFVIGGSETTRAYAVGPEGATVNNPPPDTGQGGKTPDGFGQLVQQVQESAFKQAAKQATKVIKKELTQLKPAKVAQTGKLKLTKVQNAILGKISAVFKKAVKQLGGAVDKASNKKKKLVVVGQGSRIYTTPGAGTINVKLTKAGRKLLAKAKYIDLQMTLTFTAPSGQARDFVSTVRLGKKPKKKRK
ncbi:MAG TPA: hypothetical protein VF545_12805 [Thermoleophilaceae bacterium]|jgi:hypothetical protein